MSLEKQPSAHVLTDMAKALEPALLRAGAAIATLYHKPVHAIQTKADLSPVTDADLASHDIMLEALQRLTPNWPVVSEEDSATHALDPGSPSQIQDPSLPCWLLDPLDGTKEFIARTGEFSISLGLVVNQAAYFGILYAPLLNVMYRGGRGLAAEKQLSNGQWVGIQCRVRPTDGGILISSSRSESHPEGLTFARREHLGSALKFGRIAEGTADYYLRRGATMEWDTCAGHAIVEAAGGRVTTLDGRPLRYGKTGYRNTGFIAQGR